MTERHSTMMEHAESVAPRTAADGSEATMEVLWPAHLLKLADSTVEACILLLGVMLPLYYPGGTTIAGESHKSVLLITMAAVAATAWLIGALVRQGAPSGWGGSRSLLWSGLAFLAAYAVSTVFSIHPLISFVGTLERNQGLLTHVAYAVLFVCTATRLRRRDQVDRLMTVVIVGSVPALAYGIAQQLSFDPLPSVGDLSIVEWPVRSSFGNHVYFGAYLVLLIPLTAARLFKSLDDGREAAGAQFGYALPAVLLLGLLASLAYLGYLAAGARTPALFAFMPALLAGYALLGVALDTVSRAPALRRARVVGYALVLVLQVAVLIMTSARGAMLGTFATLPLFALLTAWRFHRPRIAWAILGAAGATAIFVLVLNIPGGPLQNLRTAHALNRIANIGGYTTESSGAGRLLIWHGFATLMTQHPAIGNTWGGVGRDVVGYGPESQAQAFEAVFPLKLRVETAETYTWDRAHSMYLDILVEAGALGLLAFALTVISFFSRTLRAIRRQSSGLSWLTIGIVCAVAGYLVEGIFGVETAGSIGILWILLGLGASPVVTGEGTEEEQRSSVSWHRPSATYAGGLAAALGVAVFFDLAYHPTLFTSLWLTGILASVGVLGWVLTTRPSASTATAASGPFSLWTAPRWKTLLTIGVATGILVSILIPWQTESAAIAESAGFRYLDRFDVTRGLADLQQAARTQGYEPKYREDLAVTFFALAKRNTPSAVPGYNPQPGDALTINSEGAQALGHDQLFALGIACLKAAESLTPLDPHAHELVGDAYLQSGKPEQARSEYRQAARLSHDNPRYVDDLALVALSTAHVKTALARAQQALHLDPTFWFSYYTRALIYDRMQQGSLAGADARTALVVVKNYHPSPPREQMMELRQLANAG